jgi:hypothetical protein
VFASFGIDDVLGFMSTIFRPYFVGPCRCFG